jgi:hypothetical protein
MADTGHLEATLAELEARRARLDAAIAEIRGMLMQPLTESAESRPGPDAPSGPPSGGAPQPGAFLGMSIPEAAKKHLATVRKKLSTRALMTALEAGGILSPKYTTVYGVLRRRETQIGDIVNMQGDWALADWYPNHPRLKSKAEGAKPNKRRGKKKSNTAKAKESVELKEPKEPKESKAAMPA